MKNNDMEMEISWGIGIKDKAEKLVKKKINEGMYDNNKTKSVLVFVSAFLKFKISRTCNSFTAK